MALASFLFVAAILIASGLWLLRLDEMQPPSAPGAIAASRPQPSEQAAAERPSAKARTPNKPIESDGLSTDEPAELPLTAAAHEPPKTTAIKVEHATEQPGATDGPVDAATFRRAMNQARVALAARDVARATARLDLAARHAGNDSQKADVARLRTLAGEVGRFFEFVRAGLQKLQATDEIRVGDWIAVVVEKGPESLTLFDEGSRRDYTLATLPSKAALFIAAMGGNENLSDVKLAVGAFQLVDPEGDSKAAARLWNSAAAAGQSIDELLPLLEPGAVAVKREPVPDRAALEAAMPGATARFAAALDAARAPAQQSELAARLVAASADSASSLDQYALLARAGDLAASAADARAALQVADETARWFEVDPLVQKADALAGLLEHNPSATRAKVIARRAIELADTAVSDNRADVAKTLADTAQAAARKSRDSELIKTITDRRREITALAKKSAKSGE